MKLNQGTNQFSTNVENTSHEFSIGDPAVVIEILRNRLYSNPIQTLVQEYISNARDACRESKLPEKISVTVPSLSSKTFKVRDYGVGISPDRIANVFVKYASSTKRGDNGQVGGFGIGAKSAWAYTDNFTVISYVNGIARHYVAHLGKSNTGSLDLLSETNTQEANGTEIQIAVAEKDLQAFQNAIYRCTFLWSTRPELRGIAPSDLPSWYRNPTPLQTIEKLTFYDETNNKPFFTYGDNLWLSVDGIPYPVTYRFIDALDYISWNSKFITFLSVNTGEIEVSASRETLSDSPANQAALKALIEKAGKEAVDFCSEQIWSTHSTGDWLKTYGKYQSYLNIPSLVLNGVEVANTKVKLPTGIIITKFDLVKARQSEALRLEANEKALPDNLWKHGLLYHTGTIGKATLYAKVRHYLKATPEKSAIVLSPYMFYSHGVEFEAFAKDLGAVSIDSIVLDKKPVSQSTPKNEVTLTLYSCVPHYHRPGIETHTIDLDQPVDTQYCYVVKEEDFADQKSNNGQFASFVQEFTGRKYCFIAPSNEKKVKNNPAFVSHDEVYANPFKYVTPEAKVKLIDHASYSALDGDAFSVAEKLKDWQLFVARVNEVNDPAIPLAIKAAKQCTSRKVYNSTNYLKSIVHQYVKENPQVLDIAKRTNAQLAALSKYRLLDQLISSYEKGPQYCTEVIFYLNARYAAQDAKFEASKGKP